jgi:hypothetical protein
LDAAVRILPVDKVAGELIRFATLMNR